MKEKTVEAWLEEFLEVLDRIATSMEKIAPYFEDGLPVWISNAKEVGSG